jgi:hypothetical protein
MNYLNREFAEACARADAATNHKPSSGKTWRDGLITASELQTKRFKPVRIIVPGLIPEGVTIVAGKPKVGKSWLALDVCIAAAGDRFVLGQTKPLHGDVLYLALEDNQRRLKKRINKILDSGSAPGRLALHTEWRRVDEGGLEDIEAWCQSVSEPRLVWIDTLAKVRPVAARNEQAYAADYRAIEGLQKLAGQYQVGIAVNHHLRKMSSEDDAFDDVSGTLGITGAADTIVLMKRHSGMMKMSVRGRDIEEAEFAAEFNRNSCRWRIVGDADETFRSQERQAIIAALKVVDPDRMSIDDIMAATERRDRGATKSLLHKMKVAGEVVSEKGKYSLTPADPLGAVDRVDRETLGGGHEAQRCDNANVFESNVGQRGGQHSVNVQRRVDRPLTNKKTNKPLNKDDNSHSSQQVNAVNGSERGDPADDLWPDLPQSLDRNRSARDCPNDLEAPFGGAA